MAIANFIHLRNHSAYSLLEGALTCKNIASLCKDYSMPACGITDTNNLFGGPEFTNTLIDNGIQPIIGTQLNIDFGLKNQRGDKVLSQIILFVQTEKGYENLLLLLSSAHLDRPETEPPHIPAKQLYENNEGLILLTGGTKGPIGQLILRSNIEEAKAVLQKLKDSFNDRTYIEIQRHGLQEELETEETFLKFAEEFNLPIVATNECFFAKKEQYIATSALWCISDGDYMDSTNRRLESEEHYFKSPEEMTILFADIPSAIENTILIAKRCGYGVPKRKPLLPSIAKPGEKIDEKATLRKMAFDGLYKRFKDKNIPAEKHEQYEKQVEFELSVIDKMGFNGYFLIVADFIQWAKNNDIPVGPGRGSGAGSMVAYSLTITDLDPFRWGLLFERFLNPERVSMPDFDIDFCQDRRGEVIEYVQNKYGYNSVGQIITFGTLQAKAVIRDVGRVLRIPYREVDKISKLIPFKIKDKPKGKKTIEFLLETIPEFKQAYDENPEYKEMIDIANQLEGLFRHASTHAAGVVIGDRPIVKLAPLYKDPKSTIPSVEFDMHFVEASGLIKYDFLGLTTLSVIKHALRLIEKNHGVKLNINLIPDNDKDTFDIFSNAKTYGVFQFESQGMRGVCKRIKPNSIDDLIAIVSLYRPGPMDQIPTYIKRKAGQEETTYLHPMMEDILKPTYGIMVYQEQVMQISQKLAGYTLGGADLLRRAMGKKIKEEMEKQRQIFIDGCQKTNNIPAETAGAIFDQMEKFASYGFNKSHAACYAWIAYQTAYLKAHYPLEFFIASMNYSLNNAEKLYEYTEDAKSFGINLLPPNINMSDVLFIPSEDKKDIIYGLCALKNVGENAVKSIIKERTENGKFKDLSDFANRLDISHINKRTIESLTQAGAFDCIEKNRKKFFQNIELILNIASNNQKDRNTNQSSLFDIGSDDRNGMKLDLKDVPDFSRKEKLEQEKNIIGFYVSDHPLDTKKHLIRKLFTTPISELSTMPDGTRTKIVGITSDYSERIAKTSGNPFGLLTVSDKDNSATIMFAGKSLSNMDPISKDLLRSDGEIILITLDVKQGKDDRGPTYFGQAIELLTEKSSNSMKNIKIKVHSNEAVAELQKILSNLNKGNSQISLIIKKSNDNELQEPDITISEPELDSDAEDKENNIEIQEDTIDNLNLNDKINNEDENSSDSETTQIVPPAYDYMNDDYITIVLPETYTISEKVLAEEIAKVDGLEIVY